MDWRGYIQEFGRNPIAVCEIMLSRYPHALLGEACRSTDGLLRTLLGRFIGIYEFTNKSGIGDERSYFELLFLLRRRHAQTRNSGG
jgi:hypothetical protein